VPHDHGARIPTDGLRGTRGAAAVRARRDDAPERQLMWP
jgi:hypothetical protein